MKKKGKGITTTITAGGRSTGPMKDGIDPQKAMDVMRPVVEAAVRAAVAENKPTGKVKKISEYLRYDFSRQELVERAQELARTIQEIQRLEDNLASIKKNIQGQIAEYEAKRNRLTQIVSAGYEMRDVECEVRYNVPVSKIKTIVRLDSNEEVAVKPMEQYECQEELDFEKAEERKAKKAEPEKPAETPAEVAARAPVPEPEPKKPADPQPEAAPPA